MYQALFLGLKVIKMLGAIRVSVIGVLELIINQIKGEYLTRDTRLGYYRGTIIKILNTFLEAQLAIVSRKHNLHAHSLAMYASTCIFTFEPNHQFTTEIRHRLAIPDNVKNLQVFKNYEQINNFLTLDSAFSHSQIDIHATKQIEELDANIIEDSSIQMLHPTTFTKQELRYLKHMDIDEINEEKTQVIDLKDNHLPKGLTPLEDLFDSNEIPNKPKMEPLKEDIEEYNL